MAIKEQIAEKEEALSQARASEKAFEAAKVEEVQAVRDEAEKKAREEAEQHERRLEVGWHCT